jgi:dGTPase
VSAAPPIGYDEHDAERLVEEPIKESVRSPFARDRARVLHSAALRRLAAKTQVMVAGRDDFPRTRLTHTLEVAQIARELGAALGCDADVVEVAGLAHDLGHPPFGHNGESELDRIADRIGGFEGNAQSLRVLARLEAKVVDPVSGDSVGLNLTRASLDAACKYPWTRRPGTRKFGAYADDLPVFAWLRDRAPEGRTCIEEQVMNWSDDVAYSVHDFEDAVHSGIASLDAFASPRERRALVETAHQRFPDEGEPAELEAALERLVALDYWPRRYDGSMQDMVVLKRFTSYLIGRFCTTAQVATQVAYGPGPHTRYGADLVVPDEVRAEVSVMKAVAVLYVMNRPGAEEEYAQQRTLIAELVNALVLDGGRSLEPWLRPWFDEAPDDAGRLRVVVDQVASLTDVSIRDWHRRLVR